MTPRSIRRAAERRANKLARKAANQPLSAPHFENTAFEDLAGEAQFSIQEPTAETPANTPAPIVIPAAEANAGLTAAISSVTSHTILLPASDASPYAELVSQYRTEFQPAGLQESMLVQTLAETNWRMRRLMALEMAIFAKGRIEFAKQFAEHNPELRISALSNCRKRAFPVAPKNKPPNCANSKTNAASESE